MTWKLYALAGLFIYWLVGFCILMTDTNSFWRAIKYGIFFSLYALLWGPCFVIDLLERRK